MREISSTDPNGCRTIFGSSGTRVDLAGVGCICVETGETEEAQDEKRLYVQVQGYPENAIMKDR